MDELKQIENLREQTKNDYEEAKEKGLFEAASYYEGFDWGLYKACLIVEAALEEKEELEKAFNIIKKKEVDVYMLTHSLNVEAYNANCGFSQHSIHLLTEEEFNFLRKFILKK